MELMSLITGFGLAAGAGGRAMFVALALGAFHYTPYFELAPGFEWLAAPPVLSVLAVLTALEILSDLYPSVGELMDTLGYGPKAVAGFIALAAATGEVSDNLLALGASGLLGASTAGGVHWFRSKLRRTTRDIDDLFDRGASAGETMATAGMTGAAILKPILVPILLVLFILAGWLAYRAARAAQDEIAEQMGFEPLDDKAGNDSS